MKAQEFFESQFKENGLSSQRLYPNEELVRFLSRYRDKFKDKDISCLDVGVGSGSNLKPLLDLNLNIDAIDISKTSIELLKDIYSNKSINFINLNMLNIKSLNKKYDLILDVFTSYSLSTEDGKTFLKSVSNSLKEKGKFFSFFPSKECDTWLKSPKENHLDLNTLKRIDNPNLAYYGNDYPFRFHTKKEYTDLLKGEGIKINSFETLTRSYKNEKLKSTFLIVDGEKE